jgi:hypothetical protein
MNIITQYPQETKQLNILKCGLKMAGLWPQPGQELPRDEHEIRRDVHHFASTLPPQTLLVVYWVCAILAQENTPAWLTVQR